MITLEDCLGLCGLTEYEVLVIAEHNRLPKIAATALAERADEVVANGSRYDPSRAAPQRIVVYSEKNSRVTGELNCLHLEWRLKGLRVR
jgi:hypothetical protein